MGSSEPLNQTSPSSAQQQQHRPLYKKPSKSSDPVVYSRDFAYADNGPIVVVPTRMATDITNASARTFAELLSGPMVDIYVGPERRHWSLHQNLLCHHSSYFELEFSSHEVPKRDEGDKLDLPDDDPLGFELLVKWLYQGVLAPSSAFETDEAKYDYAVACHKLWLLCDKFDMVRLKNLGMDMYRRCLNESQLVPDAEEIDEIYRKSPLDSPFRALMVRIAARQIMDPEIERDADSYRKCFENNPDFAVEMVRAIRQMSGGILFDDPTQGDLCAYHDHNDASGCPIQGKGKVRAKRANGEGQATPGAEQVGYLQLPLVELSTQGRTPRKLRTPLKSPEVGAGRQPPATPRSLPPKLNGPGSKVAAKNAHSGSLADDGEAFSDKVRPGPPRRTLTMPTPVVSKIASNPTEQSPLATRSIQRRLVVATDDTAAYSDIQSPTAAKGKPRKLAHRSHHGETDTESIAGTDLDGARNTTGLTSRKRKLGDRTPRKIRENGPVTVAPSNSSSRADSVMSGPRKLRVNSIVRRLNSNNSAGFGSEQDKKQRYPTWTVEEVVV